MKFALVPFALASVLAVAGCSGEPAAEAEAPATTEAPAPQTGVTEPVIEEAPASDAMAPAPTDTMAPAPAADAMAPAADAMAPAPVEPAPVEPTPEAPAPAAPADAAAQPGSLDPMQMLSPDAQEAFRTQVETMTDAEKQQAAEDARATAESAARQQGLSDDMVRQVGDQAEAAARQMFGLPQ